jgi:TonB family protein
VILRVFKGEHVVEVKQFQLDQIVIGNQAEVNLNLEDSSVSPIHALIEKRNETFYICDLGSTQGTFKGQHQILDEVLESGDELHIGPFRIQFSVGAPKPKVAAPDARVLPVPPPSILAPPSDLKAPGTSAATRTPEVKPDESKAKALIENEARSAAIRPALEDGVVLSKSVTFDKTANVGASRQSRFSGTFAPPSAVPEENQVIKASKGSVLEICVGWRERIIETYHFRGNSAVTIGTGEKIDIALPSGVFSGNHVIVDFEGGVASVNLRSEMTGDLILEKHCRDLGYLREKGRLSSNSRGGNSVRLEQGEAFRVALVSDLINVYVRYVPSTQKPALVPFLPFTTGEIASVLLATALVGLLALYNAIHAPIEELPEEIQPEIISVTKFVYPTFRPPPEKSVPPPPTPPPVKVETPPKEKVKLVLGDKNQVSANNSNSATASISKANSGNSGSRAAEVAPNKNIKAKKTFTSVQQGGSIKLGAQAGANASQTQKPVDLSTVGLTSTFGGGGARNKLAQAVQGAGGIIGDANQATGAAGFSKDRPGDDLGSAFKDTGAGGKGVATEGISGGITNGRGSGNSGYGGVGSGLGNKSGVQVDVGGYGATFPATIDRNGVLRVIRSKEAVIRRCYEKELRFKKNLGGRVVVKFEIGENGRVISAKIDDSTLGDSGVESCLKNELVTWQFPEPPANSTAEVLFPFNFQNKE